MKPRILVAREVFPEVLERLRRHFEVDDNQGDTVLGIEGLKARLADAFADDREAYTQGKTAFVRQVLSGAAGGG